VSSAERRLSDHRVTAGGEQMKSPVVKRSVVVGGHKTSVSLEDAFWKEVKEIAGQRHMHLSELVASIDSERQHGNLSSAIRLFVLDFYRRQPSGQDAPPRNAPGRDADASQARSR
jgi:predicted DNA-binding ribbon-helix-helix protein